MNRTTANKFRKIIYIVTLLNLAVACAALIGSMLTGKLFTILFAIVFVLSAIIFTLTLIMARKEKKAARH